MAFKLLDVDSNNGSSIGSHIFVKYLDHCLKVDNAPNIVGPYDLMIRFIEDCSEGDIDVVPIKFHPKMQRISRNKVVVTGYAELKIPIDNQLMWSMQFDQKTAQGYKDNFVFTDFKGEDVCSVMEDYGDEKDFIKFFGAIKNGNYTGCPIDPRKHEFKLDLFMESFKKFPLFFYDNTFHLYMRFYEDLNNPHPPDGCLMIIGKHEFEMDVMVESFKKIPLFFYNTYRIHFRLYRDFNNPPDGCVMYIVDVFPKKKRKGSG